MREWLRRASDRGVLWAPAVLLVTLAGAVARVVWLDGAPPALHFDEAVYGLMAREIGPGYWPVFFPAYTGREPLYMYLMAGVFRLLGSTPVTLRLTSALIGIATLPLIYALGRELYTRRVGLLATAVAAGNYWHISLSRNGYPNILIPPLECAALLLLWRGYRDRKPLLMAAGGLFVGLVLYTYLAARLFPVTLVLFFFYALIVDRRRFVNRLSGLALAVAAALAVFAPLGLYFVAHPHDFYERASQVLVFESGGGPLSWLRTMGTNLLGNLGGLLFRGDPRPIFNLPGKPILTPVLGALMLAGLVVALRRIRRPEYGLLPIWVLGMCLPAILTDDLMPQSQRMSGIVPAVMLLVALGLDAAIARVQARRRDLMRLAPGLAAVWLLVEAGWAVWVYFGVWARTPLNYYHFHAPYQVAAEDAAPRLAAGDTAVLIAEHYKHPTALYATPAVNDAIWLVTYHTLVVPARTAGDVIYYWLRDPRIPMPYIEERLPGLVEPLYDLPDPSGAAAVSVYRVTDAAVAQAAALRARAAVGEIEVLEWNVPDEAPRGGDLPVDLTWRVRAGTTEGRTFSVHLLGPDGHLWSQHTDLGFMPEQWRAGDTVYQRFAVPLPEGIPAGTYRLAFIMSDASATPLSAIVHGEPSGFAVDLGTVRLAVAGGTVREAQDGDELGAALRVLDRTRFDSQPLDAPALAVAVTWQATGPLPPGTGAVLTLTGADGVVAHREVQPLAGGYPPEDWLTGEVVRARYALALPDLPAGTYSLSLGLTTGGPPLELGTLVASAELRSYRVPPMAQAVGARVGEQITLLGYDLNHASAVPGGALDLTLYWQAAAGAVTAPPEAKVFLHLVDAGGSIRAQVDAVPADWLRPTSGWRPGEVITDRYGIPLPSGLEPGDYMLYVGMYDAVSLQRLPLVDPLDAAVPDDRLPLAAVTVPG